MMNIQVNKKHIIKTSQLLFLIVLFLFTVLFLSPAYAETWTINKYKIVQQAPDEPRNSVKKDIELQNKRDSDFSGLVFGLKTHQMRELERYLEKVGKEYQRLGFREPLITSKTKNNDAYEIFYYDFDDDELPIAYYVTNYSNSRGKEILGIDPTIVGRVIGIDSSRAITSKNNYTLNPKVYEDLAHELFHGIQASYPTFKNNSNLGDWITEGTATAIGEDIAIKLGKLKKIKIWGQRTYSNTLWVPDLEGEVKEIYSKQEGHRTSGFWRYIGEYISSGGKAGTKQVSPPTYKYLARLFDKRIYGKTNDLKELDWVDSFLKSNESRVGRSLGDIFPLFITTLTHYAPDRTYKKTKESIKIWQKCLFVSGLDCRNLKDFNAKDIGCKKVDLTEEFTDVEMTISNVAKVSARCFEVNYSGSSNKLDIQIYMESNNKKVTDSIKAIGYQTKSSDGSKKIINVLQSNVVEADGYPNMAFWEFGGVDFQRTNRSRKKSVIFVVTNVSNYASLTYEGKENESVKFNFSYALNEGKIELSN